MLDHLNINKITDKYSSKNVPAQTRIPNIKLFLAHLRQKLLKLRHNQVVNHQHQLLQFRILSRSFLHKINNNKFQEKQELLLQRRHLSRPILMLHNKAVLSPLRPKDNLQLKVNRLSKLLDNKVRLLSQLQINSNNNSSNILRSRWFAVSTRGFCWLLVKEITIREAMDKVKLLMARMDHKVLLASTQTLLWVKPDVYATKTPTAITTQTVYSISHIIIT